MNYFIAIFIFCVVLFLYLHIYYHLKTSNDLEVYTIERPSKNKLEEICDLRQPVVFEFSNERLLESCNLATLDDNYGAFDNFKIENYVKIFCKYFLKKDNITLKELIFLIILTSPNGIVIDLLP